MNPQTLSNMTDPNFAFFMARKMIEGGIRKVDHKIICSNGDEQQYNREVLKYHIERILFRFLPRKVVTKDILLIVSEYEYIFRYELSSNDILINMLGAEKHVKFLLE